MSETGGYLISPVHAVDMKALAVESRFQRTHDEIARMGCPAGISWLTGDCLGDYPSRNGAAK